ncbi:outer membrane protein assembly factor BamA [Myroides gitamensis]|nr:outer membrane protein assembly factor BamA [Myroides gitamensis]
MKLKKKNSVLLLTITGIAGFFISSCSSTKYIPEEDALYTKGIVELEETDLGKSKQKEIEESLESLLRPEPNSSFLGFRPKLFFYNLGGNPTKTNKVRRWMRNSLGEPPVLFSQVDLEHNRAILVNRMENDGYFNVRVKADTLKVSEKKKAAQYTIVPGTQFTINDVTFLNDSTPLQQAIYDAGNRWTRLRKDKPYNLEQIKEERVRFDNYVKNKGYYYFSPNNLLVQVDSTVGNHKVNLFVKVKEDTPVLATKAYTINKVYIFSDYSLADTDIKRDIKTAQTYKGFEIIDPKNKFKPSIYDRTVYLEEGELYNRNDHNLSLNRLVNLGVFKYVKNQFELADTVNNKLDVYYFLTPDNPKSIRLEFVGKNKLSQL